MVPVSPVTETVVKFLKNIPPFQFLNTFDLTQLADSMSMEYFPKDTVILSAGNRAADSLYIVQKGGVKLAIRTAIGKELVLDLRSEGELFGLLSLMGRDVARLDVIAVEDTVCYAIPDANMQHLITAHEEVAAYLFRTSLTRYMDRSLKELREQNRLMGDSERLLYSLPASEVATQPALVCTHATPIQEAARMMAASGASCIFVADAGGRAIGIVTDRDFARKVVALGRPPDLPVESIMSRPVIAVEGGQLVFEALLAMLSRDIHHVLVTQNGLAAGVLTNHDLMLLQGKSPLHLVRHLERQETVEGLAEAQKRVGDLLPLLLREGARAGHITRVIAEVNDRVIARILDIAQAEFGPPPAPFCWVVTGSEGRSEQTFKTDQDNALIYADAAAGDPTAEAYFARLATFARDALTLCGYPLCEGDYMATNPRWRQPLGVWRQYFSDWIASAERRSAEDALIFFDMRPVAGDATLFEDLKTYTQEALRTAGLFKSVLAYVSIDHKPPLGFFKTLVVERTGRHRQELDLKLYGTGPIVNAARLLALDAGFPHTNTIDRLDALGMTELRGAFEFLTLLRLECQLRQVQAGKVPSNYIRPESLTNLQRSTLKQAFRTVARAQQEIEAGFRSAEWSQLAR